MNRNLFGMEIRRNMRSFLTWTIIITVLVAVTMMIYRTFLENQSKIMAMMSIVPKGTLQFKGISNIEDIFSVLGFYAANNVIYMMVLGSIFSIVLTSNILLREEYNKTAEFLLTWPLKRSEIFFSKVSVSVLNVFLLNLITSAAGLICIELVKTKPFSIGAFLVLSFYTFMLNLLFGAIGLFLSTIVKRPKPITTFSIGLVLIMYFIVTLSKITQGASGIGYISPFKFVDVDVVNPFYGFDFWYFMYFFVLSVLFIFLAYRFYVRKDIYT